jgi:hypothetical protein
MEVLRAFTSKYALAPMPPAAWLKHIPERFSMDDFREL